ncbi:MAG TPA: hypothetical protein H9786_11930 [Candidatus Brachybacterium merdavium]|uniref:Uncharacterized protein n=1 Tax=Candidatus Brachybacterium merdavium TaxID=2838513 RepID=A0A9D2LEN4_9MICO|nr:hypothetical protein [Candidatus Brachybacterium merdavium]
MTTSPPVDPSATSPPRGAHRTRTVVLIAAAAAVMAGLAGLGLGGLGGVLVSSDGLGGGDRTGQDIADGCAILERLKDDLPAEGGSVTLEEPLLFELGAAGQLFMVAGAGDQESEAWLTGSELMDGMSTLDVEKINDSVETAQSTICA